MARGCGARRWDIPDGIVDPDLLPIPSGVIYGDFNGDRKLDLAYVGFDYYNPYNPPRNLRVMLGDGTGKFHKGWSIWDQTGYGFQWLAVGDFNGDGKLDLAVIRTFKVDIFLGNGDGTFRNFKEFPVPGPPGAYGVNLVVGDFNRDGKLDLLTEDEFGDVYLLVERETAGSPIQPRPSRRATVALKLLTISTRTASSIS